MILLDWESKTQTATQLARKMAGRIYFLFSADYELFFGENYLPEREILIEPTERLLLEFERQGVPITLFADVASIWRYQKLDMRSDYVDLFENQLKMAIRGGHDVQLHLHPHWLTSDFNGRAWSMDESRFKLSDIGYGGCEGSDDASSEKLIYRGKQYLEDLLKPVDSQFECIAFRAGGYGIQPEDKKLIHALLTLGFQIDSSIVPGMVFKSNVNAIDFRKIPAELNYRMGTRFGIYKAVDRGIFEIPVAAYRYTVCRTLLHRLLTLGRIRHLLRNGMSRTKTVFARRGRGIQSTGLFKRIFFRFLSLEFFVLEFSGPYVDVEWMVKNTRKLVDRHLREEADLYLSVSCHPKNMYGTTICAIREFWGQILQTYGARTEAITFQQAGRKLVAENRTWDRREANENSVGMR